MIDCLIIFSKSGTVHYSYTSNPDTSPIKTHLKNIDKLIYSNRLNSTEKTTTVAPYVLEWDSNTDFVAVAIYKEVLAVYGLRRMQFVKFLLSSCVKEFALFYDVCRDSNNDCNHAAFLPLPASKTEQFDSTFQALLKISEKTHIATSTGSLSSMSDKNLASVNNGNTTQTAITTKGKPKKQTVWHGKGKITQQAMNALDRSKDKINSDDKDADVRALMEARATYLPSADEIPSWAQESHLDDNVDEDERDGWGKSLKGLFDQMSGNKILSESDIDSALKDMEHKLVSKNVNQSCAKEICDNVKSSIIGKKLATFSRVKLVVRTALESSIARVLTPQRSVDILRDVKAKRGSFLSRTTRPYVIVMVGINGVGKSTSLAKLAYYLKSNGCSPLLAACDTFRAGAVEQLRVHAKCLEVPIFSQGYAKDASNVAKAAIQEAIKQHNDVVLVDTAGRMQNNVPLMNALSKLVAENNPDLVCFVGEALVGNDGIDQLQMFDKALRNGGERRCIDGIILTKFDTVSDKVGAALSMSHITGQPVLFVGTGQKYNHLKKLSVPVIIKSLFS